MKESEGKGTQSELNLFKKAVEKSGEVIFLTDRQGTITFVNPEFSRLYGYHSDEVVAKTTPRILKSGLMSRQEYEQFWETLLNHQVVRGEFINKRKDGSLVTVEGSANPILDENENIIGFLAIQRDITDTKRVKDELKSAHAFQQAIIDGIAEPVMVIGSNYQVSLANRAAREFATEGSHLTEPYYCYQISHHRETPCNGVDHPCPLKEVNELGQTVTVSHEHYDRNGEQRLFEIAATPFWAIDGAFAGVIESMRDITEYQRTEQAMLQYADRLKALAAQLAEVEDAERQRLARELHDRVGQNLTALGISLNIIQMQIPEDTSPSVHYHLDDSLSLVDQTAKRIRDVMADLRPPVLDDYGLVAALRWYAEKISRRIDIPISVEGQEPDPRMGTRVENALFRITQEALTNATKHAQASQVAIAVTMFGDTLHLSVADDGVGFDSQDQSVTQGWGLLSITERAEAVGGRAWIVSSPNKGTIVNVEVSR